MTVNTTSKPLLFTDSTTGRRGVILPNSSHVLFESDIDSKIQKAKSQICHLSNAQGNKGTHGGKKYRARQLANRDQAEASSQRLASLLSAKKILTNQNVVKESNPISLRDILMENSIPISNLEGYNILERSPYAAIFAQSCNT